MKLLTLALLVFMTTAAAWEPDRTSTGYTSNTGTRYQYKMNNAAYKIRYQGDTVAQSRDDQIYAGVPVVQIDRSPGIKGVAVKFPLD